MKRSKRLILMLLLLVLAVAFYAVATAVAKREEVGNEEPEETDIPLVDTALSNVVAVSFQSGSLSYSIELTGEIYTLQADAAFPLDQVVAESVAEGATYLSFLRQLESDDLAAFGLHDPAMYLTARYADGTEVRLAMGDYNKYAGAYYCRSGEGIYLLAADLLAPFEVEEQDLLQDEYVTEPKNGLKDVIEIRLDRENGESVIYTASQPAEGEEGLTWLKTLLDGTAAEGDAAKEADAIYDETFDVLLDRWAGYNVTGAQRLGVYGLDTPAVTVTVRYTETVVISGEGSATVTQTVERVTGFLIGDAFTEAESRGAESDSEEPMTYRYFMLEGGKTVYVLAESELAGCLGIDTE